MIYLLQIYPSDLEAQTEYNGFKEWLLTFELYRGKKTGDDVEDESRVVGSFKVSKWLLLFNKYVSQFARSQIWESVDRPMPHVNGLLWVL